MNADAYRLSVYFGDAVTVGPSLAEAWPLIDELTTEHGIVTSLFVPGYRERVV